MVFEQSTLRDQRVLICIVFAVAFSVALARPGFSQKHPPRVVTPHPLAIWPAGPLDVVVAFDTALDMAAANAFVGKTIPYFELALPTGEQTRPPQPLGSLRIVGARLSDNGRTLNLATDPHPRQARYVLPPAKNTVDRGADAPSAGAGTYTLSGVEAAWTPDTSPDLRPLWTGWWPRLDLEATRNLTRGSKPHENSQALFAKPGRLTLGTLVRLPKGMVTVSIESSQPIEEAILGDAQAEPSGPDPSTQRHRASLQVQTQGEPLFLSITGRTAVNARPFSLKVTYRVADSKTDHELDLGQTILPWAPVPAPAANVPLIVPDLAGGDPARGKMIFNGETARCSQCHVFRGQGGKVGPDLTEIGKKGRAEIYRAIAAPSAAIEPEFTSYTVATKTGQVVVGVVRAEGADAIRVTDTNAHSVVIPRADVDQIRPSANSIMPVGLTGALGDAAVRDLIAFLTN